MNFEEHTLIDEKFISKNSVTTEIYTYELFALIEHKGGLSSGHYIAYTKRETMDGEDWYYFSDTKYMKVRIEKVLDASAYILFYKLINEVKE